MIWRLVKNNWLVAVLIIGFLLRIVSSNQSLWMDEAISARFAKEHSYFQIANEVIKSDTHPPFYYLLLKFWTDIFGYSEISLRFPSVVFGVLTVIAIYKIAKPLGGKKSAFPKYAAVLTAVNPFLIYYSQEVRMYALSTFLVSLAFLFYLQKKWSYFSVILFFIAVSDYLPLLALVPIWIYTIFRFKNDKNNLLKFFASHILLLVFWIFWYPTFKFQSSQSLMFLEKLPDFGSILGFSNLKNIALVWIKFLIGRINFSPSYFYASIVCVVSIFAGLGLFCSLKKIKRTFLFWLWFFVPLLLSFLVSIKVPGFSYFRLIFTLPAFVLLISYGFSVHKRGNVLFTVFLVFQLFFSGVYLFNQKHWREDWMSTVSFVENKLSAGEVVFISYPEIFTPYGWYMKKPESVKIFNNDDFSNYRSLYTLDYLMDLTDPGRENYKMLEDAGFENLEVYNFRGVGQIRYWRK